MTSNTHNLAYQCGRRYQIVAIGMVPVWILVGAALLFVTVIDRSAIVPVVVVWLLGGAWYLYWLLHKLSYRLEVDGDDLKWAAPLHGGSVPVNELRRSRPMRLPLSNVQVIETAGGRVLVAVARGLGAFLDALTDMRPGFHVRHGLYSRLADGR